MKNGPALTSTQKLRSRFEAERTIQDAELQRVAQQEFPLGSEVKWIHTYDRAGEPIYRFGKVVEHDEFRWRIKAKTGTEYHKYCYEIWPA